LIIKINPKPEKTTEDNAKKLVTKTLYLFPAEASLVDRLLFQAMLVHSLSLD